MAQKTNLNINPYYDDFSSDKNFYKVLFKPGYPVQARELTTLQSILQNQVESVGGHIFKEGSVVSPGNFTYDGQFYAVKLNTSQSGIDISVYIDNFVGKTITGSESGTTARIQKVVLASESSDVDYLTIYVKYLNSDDDFEFNQFQNGELLSADENVTYGNTTISAGTSFASLISDNATFIGSAAYIGNSIYFVRGCFVSVTPQTLILDYYTNTPSYRVGLQVDELIIDAKDDPSLYDNAKGFTNYAAPGADRFKITLTLSKKSLSDTNDTNFIELLRIKDGLIKKLNVKTQYNQIRDWIAGRTYDESGDYSVRQFDVSIHNSLNDRLGNNGIFFETEKTEDKNTPSDDLMCIKMSPGLAYVRGYEVPKSGTTIVDVEKPRDIEEVSNMQIPFEMGNILRINNAYGVAKQRATIDLYNRKIGDSGAKIGDARVYSCSLTDASYSDNATQWNLRLYDIQTYTKLTLNASVSSTDIPNTAFIQGSNSGASGYATAAGDNSTVVMVRQTSGTFSKGEPILVNGIDFSRTIKEFISYGTQNIKSVTQDASSGYPAFTADSVLEKFNMPGRINQLTVPPTLNAGSTFICTSTGSQFVGIKTDTIISYQRPGFSTETYNRVTAVATDGLSITLGPITSGAGAGVTGVYDGDIMAGLTTSTIVTPFAMGPVIRGTGTLFAPLPDSNISSIDLYNSTFTISEQLTAETTSGSGVLTFNLSDVTTATGIQSAVFSTFDQDRYSVHYTNGEQGAVTEDTFDLAANEVNITGLENGKTAIVTNITLSKYGVQSKIKTYNRSQTINITQSKYQQSGAGINTSIVDGLNYNEYYGIRVQDEEICLNYPDVAKVLKVYESLNAGAPILDQLQFSASANVDADAIIGENLIGATSQAIARVVSSPSANNLKVSYLTDDRFSVGESVTFDESNIITDIETITLGNYKDITNSYNLNKGQKDEYYDYSRLVRKKDAVEPSRQLLVLLDYYSVPGTDDGDVFTVLSYDKERFAEDIPNIGRFNIRASDTLDFRPRVSVFNPAAATGSPFDFSSRSLDDTPKLLMAPNEGSIIGYDYYLPRIDKVYLGKNQKFIIEKGISSKFPKAPKRNDALMELATINLPPYLYNPQNATISLVDNRRYTMRDIGNIDDRVEKLESVTSLSLLEISTQTLQIQDADGRNRFKSGFFVDDFKNYSLINRQLSSVEINPIAEEMIPIVSRNSLKSYLAPASSVTDSNYNPDENFDLLDPNVQKTGSSVTLKYDQIDWIEQPFATTTENVNPFNVVVYSGTVQLRPTVDTWVRTIQLPDKTINVTNNSTRTLTQNLTSSLNLNLGYIELQGQTTRNTRNIIGGGDSTQVITTNTTHNVRNVVDSDVSTATNVDTMRFDDVNTRNQLVSAANETFMRSRNTEFNVSNLKPYTRFYQFIDGQSGIDFVPKLIEIANNTSLDTYGTQNGTFIPGEEVRGYDPSASSHRRLISFRVANSNHKYGSYNNPSSIYNVNPYVRGESIPDNYSQDSKILNVDTVSLSSEAQGLYSGYILKGMKLVGQESGAIAWVKDLRLISDNYGDVTGTFFIRDPFGFNPIPSVRLQTGTKTFKITSSATNETGLPGSNSVSFAIANYSSKGTVNRWENEVTTTTNILTTSTTTNLTTNASASIDIGVTDTHIETTNYFDPLAQTFIVGGNVEAPSDIDLSEDVNGVFLTSVDLFFAKVDAANAPLRVQVRTVEFGTPTMTTLGKTVTLRPTTVDANGNIVASIQTSTDGSVATNVKFPEPIWLAPNKEYAIVVISANSDAYELWTAIMGEKTVGTRTLPDVESVRYTQQFALGSLFKSQNGSIWEPTQLEDLKFKLYKAQFSATTGTAFFYNPTLSRSNGYVPRLPSNPIRTLPKTATLGISTIASTESAITTLGIGRKLSGSAGHNGSAVIVGQGSSVFDCGEITNGGSNYVSDTSVETYAITGNGSGLTLNITATSGVIGVATFANIDHQGGHGYKAGDVVGIVTSTVGSAGGQGREARITISATSGNVDTLYLSGIQGEIGGSSSGKAFAVGLGLTYHNDAGSLVSLASTTIRTATVDGGVRSGNYMKVDHFNHNMYSSTNKVVLSDIESSVVPTTLATSLNSQEVTSVSVASTVNFGTFEGVDVSATNPGYVKINDEIIKYDGVSGGTLSIDTDGRGIDATVVQTHDVTNLVYKYELNGISLRRINRIAAHDIKETITSDGYYIEIDRSDTDYGLDRSVDGSPTGMPQLSFTNESSLGGSNARASENISYSSLVPTYDIITPGSNTSATATIRTISGTSIDGTESSFNDLGFEPIGLNVLNNLKSTRIVCSNVNENEYLSSLPRNKSFTTGITLSSSDVNLSPIINLNTAFTEFVSNRLDKPITDYATDSRVNSIFNDPHAAVYVSNTINLANPASQLKVLCSAYRDSSADFRVLYNLIKADSSEVDQTFTLFPGYNNLKYTDESGFIVTDESKNSGLPDNFVQSSVQNQYLEYEFTADNLDLFTGYTIKIVMSGTNQALPPRIKELRTIAVR